VKGSFGVIRLRRTAETDRQWGLRIGDLAQHADRDLKLLRDQLEIPFKLLESAAQIRIIRIGHVRSLQAA
jgi:hypothetical protein